MVRRLLVVLAALLVAAVLGLVAAPVALQWWSVRRSADPDVALAALTCQAGGGRVVTSVESRPWGWVVRTQQWRVAYLGADDNASGAPATYVTKEDGVLVPWQSGSSPPTDPATGVELTAPGAADPWEADLALAATQSRDPYVAERCVTERM
jgi:hypothetical protein